MKIGIDAIEMDTPDFYVDLVKLAKVRGDDPNKYTIGIGQDEQAVPPSSQDIVTLGANAAAKVLTPASRASLGMILVGTESGVDASKSAALFIHDLLALPEWVRAVELKEACYGGTAALMMARDYVASHPDKSVLVIAADIAHHSVYKAGQWALAYLLRQLHALVARGAVRHPHIQNLTYSEAQYAAYLRLYAALCIGGYHVVDV